MNKNELNSALRKFVQKTLSPTSAERDLVTNIYAALQTVLGVANCLQIGSYPRFTAITPLYDLDVLYRVGDWPGPFPNPADLLRRLKSKIETEFKNPTTYKIRVDVDTHSITIGFISGTETVFAVDVVPGYSIGLNEFREEMYMVPEIVIRRPTQRRVLYEEMLRTGRGMNWIRSDPRGYNKEATLVNERNEDFRKSAKLAKAWKWACKEQDEDFKLVSFHIEQVITLGFNKNLDLEISDAMVAFFANLPSILQRAQISDRADPNKYIDEYVNDLTETQKQVIIEAGRLFLRKLQSVTSESDIEALLSNTAQRANKARTVRLAPKTKTAASGFTPKSPWGS